MTGSKQLVFHIKSDKFWGDGGDKGSGTAGKNALGKVIMEIRISSGTSLSSSYSRKRKMEMTISQRRQLRNLFLRLRSAQMKRILKMPLMSPP